MDTFCFPSESGQGEEPEPGEYIHGPSKRLEVVSECKWERRTDRTYIMRVLCEHMDKDRLKTPFWIGKYRIQPISQSVVDEGQGPCVNYKVLISQPQLGLLKDKIQTQLETKPPEPPATKAVPKPEQQRPVAKAEPKAEPRAEPTAKHRMMELLPKLRPEQGLPFLAGVPTAGLLIAQYKAGEDFPITVCSCIIHNITLHTNDITQMILEIYSVIINVLYCHLPLTAVYM